MQFTAEGQFIRTWGSEGLKNGQFHQPVGIAVSPDGNVYVSDNGNHRIQQFTAKGDFIRVWGRKGSAEGEFDFPSAIVIADDGSVYVADDFNHRIQQFNAEGVFIRAWETLPSAVASSTLSGLAIASDGSIFAVVPFENAVLQFSTEGDLINMWRSEGTDKGQFSVPEGIAVAPDGSLYIADTGNHRIQKFCLENCNQPVTTAYPVKYNEQSGVLFLHDVIVDGKHYQAELKSQDDKFVVISVIDASKQFSSSAQFDFNSGLLNIPHALAFGKDYQATFKHLGNLEFELVSATPK